MTASIINKTFKSIVAASAALIMAASVRLGEEAAGIIHRFISLIFHENVRYKKSRGRNNPAEISRSAGSKGGIGCRHIAEAGNGHSRRRAGKGSH